MTRARIVLAACLLVTSGCFGSGSRAAAHHAFRWPVVQTHQANGYALRFSYPPNWRLYRWQVVSSFSSSMAYLSTDREHNPCRQTASSGGIEIRCASPLYGRLAPGGVFAEWNTWAWPTGAFAGFGGVGQRVDGWFARVHTSPGGKRCALVGGSESIVVHLARTRHAGEGYELDACLRGPDLARGQALIERLLRSTRLIPISS